MVTLIAGILVGALLAAGARARAALTPSAGLLTEAVRTSAVSRVLLRLPNLLYERHAGWLLGHRFLQLTHRGRHSGRLYRTVLEVVAHDSASGELVVLSGWGGRSDWYRNVQAGGAVQVRSGRVAFAPTVRWLADAELYADLCAYARRNPLARPVVTRTLRLSLNGSHRDRSRLAQLGYRGVALRPEQG